MITRRGWTRLILTGLLLPAAHLPCLAAGPWKTVKPAGEKAKLPKGKTLARSVSPDGRYALLLRDEGEKGDFFWRSIYVQHGSSYTLLDTCNELRHPRWTRNPTTLRFEMDAAVGPSEMERREMTYTPSTKTLRKRVLRKLHVEGAG